ncbi:hypothetical protein [Tumidithrix helvetica]
MGISLDRRDRKFKRNWYGSEMDMRSLTKICAIAIAKQTKFWRNNSFNQ